MNNLIAIIDNIMSQLDAPHIGRIRMTLAKARIAAQQLEERVVDLEKRSEELERTKNQYEARVRQAMANLVEPQRPPKPSNGHRKAKKKPRKGG
jgi:hypothetical protein